MKSNFALNNKHSNARVLETPTRFILISYSTIVAYFDKLNREAFKTDRHWSVTTSKHIRLFLNDLPSVSEVKELPQEVLDSVIP